MTTDLSLSITGAQDHTAAFAAIYTNPDFMAAWLAAPDTLAARLRRIGHCMYVARDPQGRFGLTEVPAEVRAVISAAARTANADAEPYKRLAQALRATGHAWDEVYSKLARIGDAGFGPGDLAILGAQ